jgi:CRP/FNR family transcriptional regulator, cyclic AMP receptor protein
MEHPFLQSLDAYQREDIVDYARPMFYAAGTRIFAEDGPADQLWLIEQGRVALDLRVPGHGEQVVETITAPNVLGWSWLYPPYRWHFGAMALEDTTAIALDAELVRERCDRIPAFGYAVLRGFTPIVIDRLQAARLKVLDLYAAPAQR